MNRQVYWELREGIGLEHLHLIGAPHGYLADGAIIRHFENMPYRVTYKITMDTGWQVMEARIRSMGEDPRTIHLKSDRAGNWTDEEGVVLQDIYGCSEIDITFTPFTNTLPIRRLNLGEGQSQTIDVAYIDIQDMSVRPVKQRYTCLERGDVTSLYRYEGLETGFTADLKVDLDGLVIDYPGVFAMRFTQ
jgi:uncharacterized protein